VNSVTTSILWFRRDLRLSDHPALLAAADAADEVLPVFVLDDVLLRAAGPNRVAFLAASLRDLLDQTGGALRVLTGPPEVAIPSLARELDVTSVHISSDHGPYGKARDASVAGALEVPLVATGSPYAVTPGTLTKADGLPYKVFTPFFKAWAARGVHSPAQGPAPTWTDGGVATDALPTTAPTADLPEPGEAAARARWEQFKDEDLTSYADGRDQVGDDRTSRLSPYLKWGVLHPRTLLAELDRSEGARVFRSELAWRDFYADVLHHHPGSARADLTGALNGMTYDEPGPLFEAWKQGRTGYPIVDAGMRQLLATGWMHNRLRMITASFLTKDLHVWWRHGARHFMDHLVDGDVASNQHGWQWVAGTGTDASPYFRVFNPVTQGLKFDPEGHYVRRWVPELRALTGKAIHQPWECERPPEGYPSRVVDHAAERQESLDRYAQVKERR
jgi:deoxyribodipyrimidine photo-lyase